MSTSYPEEFAEFFKAMSAKMLEKSKVYGDSWKQDYATSHNEIVPMVAFLHNRLDGEIREYFESSDPKELVDIADCCAMLWCRKNVLKNTSHEEAKPE